MFEKIRCKSSESALLIDNGYFFNDTIRKIVETRDIITIKALIKFMANSIQGELLTKFNYYDRKKYNGFKLIDLLQHSFSAGQYLEKQSFPETEFNISETPIISCIWNTSRVPNSIIALGAHKGNPFNGCANKANISGTFVKPLGIILITNGNHTVNSAIIHNEGSVIINNCIDLSELFYDYSYNGVSYVNNITQKPIYSDFLINGSQPIFHQLGCLFDMGQVLHKNNVCFAPKS